MSSVGQMNQRLSLLARDLPVPLLAVFRGIGQVFFQENALTGACFAVGIAFSSPLMALAAVVGSAIGAATARLLKFDEGEFSAGIYGFNSALVGIAIFFFFRANVMSVALLIGGCVVAALVTWLMRRHLPFPTYTTPFIVTTWAFYFLGLAVSAARAEPGEPLSSVSILAAAAHGVSQVMFQASIWTALLFLIGIAINDWQHAAWVAVGSVVGMLLANCIATAGTQGLDPESLVERAVFQNTALGLYGYNATLAAVALFLWRRSLIPPLLGIVLSVPIAELVPMLGLPALTAPFVLATWIVLGLGWLDEIWFREKLPTPS
jgi:urea transporter